MTWQKVRIEVPEDLTRSERVELAADVLDFIKQRTASGKKVNNQPFPGYSKNYKKYGQTVDLKDTGEMLGDLRLLSEEKGSLLIGFDNGTPANDKAQWNAEGEYGGRGKVKPRPFLGISKKDLRRLTRD